MLGVTERFKHDLDIFFDFLDKKYSALQKGWIVKYSDEDTSYILYVYDLDLYPQSIKEAVLGSCSLNTTTAFEPRLDLPAYNQYILEKADEYSIHPIK